MVRRSNERVYGPYPDRVGKDGHRRWVIHLEGPDGRSAESFAGQGAEEQAKARVADLRQRLEGRKVSEAIGEYLDDMRERGLRAKSIASTDHRLRTFFQVTTSFNGGLLSEVTQARGRALLEATKTRTRKVWVRGGHANRKKLHQEDRVTPRSVDYRAGMLAESKTFLNWCADRGYVKRRNDETPLDGLAVKGKRRKGKPQLRLDETIIWERAELADGSKRAIAAVLTYYFATRSGETLALVRRDIDRGGTVAEVADSKTESGKRRVEIPPHLQPLVAEIVKGLAPDAPLFPGINTGMLRRHVAQVCKRAGVPVVCTQALRGMHTTVAGEIGVTGPMIAAQLGHADDGQTAAAHYSAPGAVERGKQRRVFAVMNGGRT